jgi:hypothetical protein
LPRREHLDRWDPNACGDINAYQQSFATAIKDGTDPQFFDLKSSGALPGAIDMGANVAANEPISNANEAPARPTPKSNCGRTPAVAEAGLTPDQDLVRAEGVHRAGGCVIHCPLVAPTS